MLYIIETIRNLFNREDGQTLSEYALILVLVVIVAIVILTTMGGNIVSVFTSIANALSGSGS